MIFLKLQMFFGLKQAPRFCNNCFKFLFLALILDLNYSNFLLLGIISGFYYHFQLVPWYWFITVLKIEKELSNIIVPQKTEKSEHCGETFYLKKVNNM